MAERNVVVYGHLNLNLIDGSAIWLTTLVETLSQTNSTVHLVLRAPVETERLLGRLRGMDSVIIHDDRPAGSGLMTDAQAIAKLEGLVDEVGASVLITRGLEFVHRVSQSDILAPVLWGYITDLSFPVTEMSEEELGRLRTIGARARKLFLQTQETRAYVESIVPEVAGKTLLMTPTVPDDLFLPIEDLPTDEELKLIYAGKFHPHWRTLEMLDLPRLLGEAGVPATLTMLGDKFQVPGEWTTAMRAGLTGNEGVHWGGGIPREDVIQAIRTHHVGLSWRTSDLDDSLELSTKLLEYSATGTPAVLNRTPAHEELLGKDYPLFLDDDSVETVVAVLAEAKGQLNGLRHRVQEAARAYSGSGTAKRLQGYFERAEPGYASHPLARSITTVATVGDVPSDLTDLLGRRADIRVVRAAELDEVPDILVIGDGADPESDDGGARKVIRPGDYADIPASVDFSDVGRPRAADDRWYLTLPSLAPFVERRPDLALDVLAALPPRFQLIVHGELPWSQPDLWADPWEREQIEDVLQRLRTTPELASRVTFQPGRPDAGNWLSDTGWLLLAGEHADTSGLAARARAAGTEPVVVDDGRAAGLIAQHIVEESSSERWPETSEAARRSAEQSDSLLVNRRWLDLLFGIRQMTDGASHGDYGQLPVSVIMPCYMAVDWLPQSVGSFAAQTLDKDLFEIVAVFNGPDDGGAELAKQLMTEAGLQFQIVHSEPGASTARNEGIRNARGAWHTFVDVDDTMSPNYLERLWAAAGTPGVVPVATMLDVFEDGSEEPSALHNQVMARQGVVSAAFAWRPMTVTVTKLLPADVSRRCLFDEDLRSGEDVALFGKFQKERLDFDTTPAHEGAVYRRMIRRGSVSRQGRTYDFMVSQRLQVIAILDRAMRDAGPGGRLANVCRVMMASQADMVRDYVKDNPDDLQRIVDEISAREIENFPWYKLPTTTDHLIVAYCFAPFADPSALVTIKRALERGERSNVISMDMSDRRSTDLTVVELAEEVVVEHRQISGPSAWEDWAGLERFCTEGMAALDDIEATQGPQRHVYSRAMFPASHLLAALIKARRPDVEWTAEFSDPLRKNIFGAERPGPVGDTAISRELLEAAGIRPSEDLTIFAMAELLAYALADRIVFTNPHQFSLMMGYLEDENLRGRVTERAVVSPQPTLPPGYYQRWVKPTSLDPQQCHIAYFGSFYPTRGFGDLLAGLRLLTPEQAQRIKVHVFTDNQDVLAKALDGHPYRTCVVGYRPLPYLEFLGAMASYDVLFVNDARTNDTSAPVNPYLPSKVADYLGSGQPIWAVVEPGSVLDGMEVAFKSNLDDPQAAAEILSALADEATAG